MKKIEKGKKWRSRYSEYIYINLGYQIIIIKFATIMIRHGVLIRIIT